MRNVLATFGADLKDIAGLWGAGLSTFLALLKIWELYRDRLRFAANCALDGDPNVDDFIILANVSPKAVSVAHWKLVWEPKNIFSNVRAIDVSAGEFDGSISIGSNETYKLVFSGEDKIDWRPATRKRRCLVLYLYVFGRSQRYKLKLLKGD